MPKIIGSLKIEQSAENNLTSNEAMLLELCRNQAAKTSQEYDPLDAVNNLDWDGNYKALDWRHYLEPRIVGIWDDLSLEVRLAIYLDAAWRLYGSY